MASAIRSSGDEPPPVWPFARGRFGGKGVEPLYSAAPEAAEEWSELDEVLALPDSLKAGDALGTAAALLGPLLDEVVLVGGATVMWSVRFSCSLM